MSKGTLVKSFIKGSGGSTSGASLFDIKVMSQLVAEKGWAFLCKSTRQDLAKADVPKLYADIKDKYDNADGAIQLTDKANNVYYGYRNVVYVNGAYYTTYAGDGMSAEVGIFKSTDGNTWSKVMDLTNMESEASEDKIYIYKKKIFFVTGSNHTRFVVFDTETDTGTVSTNPVIAGNQRRSNLFIYDNKLYFTAYNDSYKVYYVNLDELDADLTNKTDAGTTTQPIAYDGTYFYGTTTQGGSYRTLLKGTSIDSITTSVGTGYASAMIATTYEPNSTKFVITLRTTVYQVDNGTITSKDCSSYFSGDGGIVYLYKVGENELYASNGSSPYAIMHSTDNGTTWQQVFSDLSGQVVVSSANGTIFATGGSAHKLYKGTLTPQTQTDTYVINGTSVAITYYTKDGYKICLKDGGTNDTNLATVYSYMGYYPYFVLDTTGETVSLPRNSNLYSAMYVGDNYQDTTTGISGNATRLLPQAEIIEDSSASVSLAVKGNKDYQLSSSSLTALTLSSCEDSQLGTTIEFTTGATAPTFTDTSGINWADGETPVFQSYQHYLIVIFNGIGFVKEIY